MSVCLCVNQYDSNHNRWTWRLVILPEDPDTHPGQFPREKLTRRKFIYPTKTSFVTSPEKVNFSHPDIPSDSSPW